MITVHTTFSSLAYDTALHTYQGRFFLSTLDDGIVLYIYPTARALDLE